MDSKLREQQEQNDILSVMSTETGRRFIWRLLSYCRIYHDVEGGTEDILKQLGRRQVGLFILGVISEVDDERVFTMMREAKNRDMEEENERRKRTSEAGRDEGNSDGGEYDYTTSHRRYIEDDI